MFKAVTIQGCKITDFDMMASNGVIHVLSNVMMPPMGDIVAMVSGNKNFSMLLNFVSQAGLATALKGMRVVDLPGINVKTYSSYHNSFSACLAISHLTNSILTPPIGVGKNML